MRNGAISLHCKKRVFRNTKLSGNPAATRFVHPNTQWVFHST